MREDARSLIGFDEPLPSPLGGGPRGVDEEASRSSDHESCLGRVAPSAFKLAVKDHELWWNETPFVPHEVATSRARLRRDDKCKIRRMPSERAWAHSRLSPAASRSWSPLLFGRPRCGREISSSPP